MDRMDENARGPLKEDLEDLIRDKEKRVERLTETEKMLRNGLSIYNDQEISTKDFLHYVKLGIGVYSVDLVQHRKKLKEFQDYSLLSE